MQIDECTTPLPGALLCMHQHAWLHAMVACHTCLRRRRMRHAVHAAPPGSMERHNRRAAVLAAAHAAMDGGRTHLRPPGGCCSSVPFEITLGVLEVEASVVGGGRAQDMHTPPASPRPSGSGTQAACSGTVCLKDMERTAKRLAHAFPWNPTAGVHLALCMRRHGAPSPPKPQQEHATAGSSQSSTTDLNAGNPGGTPPKCRLLPLSVRRRRLIKVWVCVSLNM